MIFEKFTVGMRKETEILYRMYGKTIRAIAYQYLKDEDLAEDCLQEVMLRLSTVLDRIGAYGSPEAKGYINAIARNTAIDMRRAHQRAMGNPQNEEPDAEIAKQTGLRAGIPLVSGAGDKVGGCVGAGILDFGDMILEAASYGAVSCMVKDFRPDNEEHYFDIITSAKRGSFYAHKYSQASGIIQDWFIDQMVKTDGLDRKAGYRAIEAEAANLPAGSGGMMAIGLLGGSAIPLDTSLKGMFMGHTLMHTKAHFFRALLESHAYDLGISIDRIAAKYPEYKLDHVKIIGGGAKSAMLTQILADVTGRTFERLNRSDSALWGAAILAGSAIGAFPDMKETAHAHVAVKDVFRPDEKRYATYQKYKALYKEFIPELHSFYDRLAAIEEG